MLLRERVPGGRCLAGSGRWQTPSDPWQLFGRTNRRQHDRVGIAESVAPTRADSSAKYRRTLADRFRQQQRNLFKQATDSSTGSTERRRSNHIRSFTPLSRSMQSEDLDVFVGAWIFTCKEMIENQHGFINKYLGDGFLAYWPGAATSPEEMVAVISALKEFQQKGGPDFRFVVHFGPIAIGGIASMGEESLMGSELNLIFRLEKLAGSLGISCGLSETAHTKLGELVPTRSLGEFELKGFERKRAFFAL